MPSRHGNKDFKRVFSHMYPAGDPPEAFRLHLICPDSLMVLQSEKYRLDPFHFFYYHQLVVIAV